MWLLLLNDMRQAHVEDLLPAFRAETREALERLLKTERVEGYMDGKWGKAFRAGGPLEWYNAPYDFQVEQGRVFVDVDAYFRAYVEAQVNQLRRLPEAL